MIVLALSLSHKITGSIFFYACGGILIRQGLKAKSNSEDGRHSESQPPSSDTHFRKGTVWHLAASFMPRQIERWFAFTFYVGFGLFFMAIPTLTIVGVWQWPR